MNLPVLDVHSDVPLLLQLNGTDVVSVTGNTCPRGDAYARKEVTNPTRIVTSTVRVEGGISPMVNVKTASDIPKAKIFECASALKNDRCDCTCQNRGCCAFQCCRNRGRCRGCKKYCCKINQRSGYELPLVGGVTDFVGCVNCMPIKHL